MSEEKKTTDSTPATTKRQPPPPPDTPPDILGYEDEKEEEGPPIYPVTLSTEDAKIKEVTVYTEDIAEVSEHPVRLTSSSTIDGHHCKID